MHYRPVGETAQNLAITRFDVKESFDRPGEYHAFVRVNNFGADGYDVIVFDNCAPKALGAGR
ncbi:MAG TPA: hypothetical protein EYP14_06925 [Planctomycetaceae bacterium]|nr:hypothetical protein [Planctomycetaceae bacterium]